MGAPFGRWRDGLGAMSGVQRHLMACVFGVLAGGAMAPFHLVFLLVPGFTGLIWLLATNRRRRQAFSMGWAFGIGHFAVGFYWVGNAFLVDAARYGWLAPFAVLALAAGIALFIGLATLLSWALGEKFRMDIVAQVLVLAGVWTAFEWVRSWLFTGFPWNLIGTVWAFSDDMMQFAAYAGVYGLGLVTILVAAMPAVIADVRRPRAVMGIVGACGFGLVLIWGGGVWRLAAATPGYVEGITLRLVQPNIPQNLKWKPRLRSGHIKKQAALSLQPAKDGIPPTHILWAETAVPFNLTNQPNLLSYLGRLAPPKGYVIAGAPRSEPKRSESKSSEPRGPSGSSAVDPRYWNSLIAVAPDGEIAAVYDKIHLVPFGEYVPFRSILSISKLTAGRVDFASGEGARVWNLPGLPAVAPLICYEAIFPAEVGSLDDSAKWLLNATNDAWFGLSAGPYQHFAAVRFRAIEMGLPLVRVANTGISAVVDAYGRVGAHLDLGVEGVIDSGLPKALSHRPLYGRFGDWVTLVLVVGCAGGGLLVRRKLPN